MTMAQLESTPGYQFSRDQGLKAIQNRMTASGLGSSGPAAAAAGEYATGLASGTFQTQFGNYLAQNQQIYNMLTGVAGMGQNAATNVGTIGAQATTQANALATGGAAATGAGLVGGANALASGLSGAGSAASNGALMYALNSGGLFTNPLTPKS